MDVDKILKNAFLTVSRDVISGSQCFNGPGSPSTAPDKLTPYDRVANAVYIIMQADNALSEPYKTFILALYTVPVKEQYSDKDEAIEWISDRIGSGIKVDRYYIRDQVRKYCNTRPHHNLKWWCEHLKKDQSTLYRHTKVCNHHLDDLYERSLSILSSVY